MGGEIFESLRMSSNSSMLIKHALTELEYVGFAKERRFAGANFLAEYYPKVWRL